MKKKMVLFILVSLFMVSFSVVAYAKQETYLLGDVNMDGVVDSADSKIVNDYIFAPPFLKPSLTEMQKQLADINKDGLNQQPDLQYLIEIINGTRAKEYLTFGEPDPEPDPEPSPLADVITLFKILVTAVLQWAGSVVLWFMSNRLLLIPIFVFFLAGGVLGIVRRTYQ